jgi:hypothetical protein
MITPESALRVVKVVHTAAWAFFVACILAIPMAAWLGNFKHVLILTALVFFEIGVLIVNGWACPLTRVAARYTEDRRDNFDIYLPLWLARHNKTVFGWIFAAGLLFAFACWQRWIG